MEAVIPAWGKFLTSLYPRRVPMPHADLPPDIRKRFNNRRPVFLWLDRVAWVSPDGWLVESFPNVLSDGASVPPSLSPWEAMTGREYDAVGVLHDMLCRCARKLRLRRSLIDKWLREMLRCIGYSSYDAWRWWVAVRLNAAKLRVWGWFGADPTDITNPERLVNVKKLTQEELEVLLLAEHPS